VGVGVGDGGARHGDATWRSLDHGLGLDQAFLQGQTDGKWLHGGAGLKGICQRAVAQLCPAEIDPPLG